MSELLAVLGMTSISVALLVLGRLSRRLGRVTKARAYYRGFYLAALLVAVGVLARLVNLGGRLASHETLPHNTGWVLLYFGAPALGVTLGVVVAWRYWSWLLAERG